MGQPTYSIQAYIDRLTAINAASYPTGVGVKASIKLFDNDVEPDENQTVATFNAAPDGAYPPIEVVMAAPSLNNQGMVVTRSQLISWTSNPEDPATVMYGVFITNAANDKVIAAQRFDEPQPMGGGSLNAVAGVWRSSEPLTGYGWVDVEA